MPFCHSSIECILPDYILNMAQYVLVFLVCHRTSNKKFDFFFPSWNHCVSLSADDCQDWHHVGCRWRLRLGWHDGRGTPCGGAASQAYGQPVEQSAVLNLDPEPAVHIEVCLILTCRSTHTCGFSWTQPWQKMSLSVTLTDPHHSLSEVLAPTQVLSIQSRVSVTD